ncbi:isoprenylcysteine carboxyl methyltransferase family protein [Phyllobacterium endophyticum]|uniref:isoprenylcysteine carboxyl methyltransferase family protein n=1 Tax=Phyllobacterium endophyticum TaxID=1149773 RepID=UPI0011C83FDA|nr:isoprenylcysteine carboxylmethyltransferase family protein [Phyllobacterium endophyticum]TXR48421.1 hypothetical protein FVA77_15290 [Phyllobacterium endophyticum]
MIATFALLGFVTLERLGELLLARHNTRTLIAKGAYEASPGHYPLIVVVHAVWLAGMWVFAGDRPIAAEWFAVFILLQGMRLWVLATLGERWTTRIIVLPGRPLVRTGPYRIFSHPNYVVVVGEIAILPLCFGLVWYSLVFSLINALVLAVRIRTENSELLELRRDAGA